MEQDLISKKELLEATGISYGQLYRWKRERLLPEDWFIKKSSYTGQETFFPREQALSRIQSILELKDSHSLEELAELLASPIHTRFTLRDLRELAGLKTGLLDALGDERQDFSFGEAVLIVAFDERVKAGMDIKDVAAVVLGSREAAQSWAGDSIGCTVFSLKGIKGPHIVFHRVDTPPLFDEGIEVMGALALIEAAVRIKQDIIMHFKRKDLS